jgi:hypothetical protein
MATTAAYSSNIVVEESLSHTTWVPGTTLVTLAAGTLALTRASTTTQIFSGSTAAQIVKMPDGTTLIPDPIAAVATIGWTGKFYNDGTVSFAVQDSTGTALFTLNPGQRVEIKSTLTTAAAGWTWQITDKSSLKTKSGVVALGAFAGNPKTSTVTFTTAYPDTNYSILLTGTDARFYTYQTKLAGGFVINCNANQALTGPVQWETVYIGET